MNVLQSKTGRRVVVGCAAMGTGLLLVFLTNTVAPGALGPLTSALLASGAAVAVLLSIGNGRQDEQVHAFTELVGHSIDDIMIGAAETSFFVDSVKKKIEKDVQSASVIAGQSEHVASSTEQIADHAERAATIAALVRTESVAGRAEIDSGLKRIGSARIEAELAGAMMVELQSKSKSIAGFTEVITEISARTNLLALNAAIEAARAGEHGRGFAVVAGEVRQLAFRTKEATDEISAMVRAITEQAEKASRGMISLTAAVGDAAGNVDRVHHFLGNIETSSGESESQIRHIADEARAHVATTGAITKALMEIRDSMLSTNAELPRATESAMALAEKAESIAGALSESHAETPHDAIREATQRAALEVGKLFSDAIKAGQITREALFDRNYVPIPNTNPPKHTTKFDSFTDRALPALQEQLLVDLPQLAFAGAVDNNGYFPTHNKKFSKPLTGKYDVDIVNNRTKRIFNDRTGSRCGANTKPFLLQTYKRDTGEVMHDMSAPIYVDGRHWGGFRVGYRSSAA